ncbi:MAG: response regulator transcription factor [Planctomycetota bacterium]
MAGPSNLRLLVVEDDAHIRAELLDALRAEGFEAEVAVSYAMAQEALERHYDLVLLDLCLPDGDGLDLCRALRTAGRSVPIILLTARDAPEQKVSGLDAGADDYVAKPYHLGEVVARIRSLLRRTGKSPSGGFVRHLDLWIDLDRVQAGREDEQFRLKPREFDLLSFLVRNPGRAWTRAQLLDQVWGHEYSGDERTVDLHVRRLRAKLEENFDGPSYIETVWGVGYRMREGRHVEGTAR